MQQCDFVAFMVKSKALNAELVCRPHGIEQKVGTETAVHFNASVKPGSLSFSLIEKSGFVTGL